MATLDFETYSEAGHVWGGSKWGALPGAGSGKTRYGLFCVGAAVYAQHPSTRILCAAYDLGDGPVSWVPGDQRPNDLFEYVAAGGILDAWNAAFERWIWTEVGVKRYGWPRLRDPIRQFRCDMARARSYSLPGSLDKAGAVLQLENRKLEGKRLLDKFSKPRNPTAKDRRARIRLKDDPVDARRLVEYNVGDIVAEAEAASRCPPLDADELEFWFVDQAINLRGVCIDLEGVENCIAVIEQAHARYNAELYKITHVDSASEVQKLLTWLKREGFGLDSLDEETVSGWLKRPALPEHVQRVLKIRQMLASSSVKKVYAMRIQAARGGRLHDLFTFHGARTGRATGNGPQPQNLPRKGPPVSKCRTCGHHHAVSKRGCSWCGATTSGEEEEWGIGAVEHALSVIATRDFEAVEHFFGDAMSTVSGCLRGLFVAAEGHDLICSDYSAIEAVVLAMVSGEQWRIDTFRGDGKIYERSASKITGIPYEEYAAYKARTGHHHPTRNSVGKIAELALGYQGWIGAWKQFGGPGTDDEIKKTILVWRDASPAIPCLWGNLELAAIRAATAPGTTQEIGDTGMTFRIEHGALRLKLPSGRHLTYHSPIIRQGDRGKLVLDFWGWNSNPKQGAMGWVRLSTWGGKLTENVVQAISRDILRHAMVALERAGYPIVLHVYDEIVAEVPKSFGSIGEFERIMATMPAWAEGWPIRATGGWRGKRFRKG